jgi:hypothetical protein
MAERWWDTAPLADDQPAIAKWWETAPLAEPEKPAPDMAVDVAKGVGYGFNTGLDDMLNMIGAPIRAPINAASNALGYGEVIPELNAARRFNVAGPAETTAGRTAEAVGEVAGGSVIPSAGLLKAGQMAGKAAAPIVAHYGAAPGAAIAADAGATLGAGLGVSAARENDLGPVAEVAAGLAGGYAGPNAVNLASRGVNAVQGAKGYTGRMMARARDPQLAADQDTVDAMLKSGVSPQQLYNEFAPAPSKNLQGRGVSQEKMAEVISRASQGEDVATLAKEVGVAPTTLQGYLRDFKAMNPTPRNIADAVTDQANVGGAQPVLRLGRAAYGIADDAQAAQAMTGRQNDQYGRVVGILNKAAKNRDYDATIGQIDEALGIKSKQAYGLAHQNEQPFDLKPVVKAYRDESFRSAGRIKEGLDEAIDMFFMPVMGPDGKVAKLGEPISDVPRYQAAREALDQMIQTSKHEGKATPLTRKLTQFRKAVNETVRKANPLLASADDQFSGAKSTQELIKRGEDLTTQLGSKQDEFFKSFKGMSPEQQEIVRMSFLRKLANQAARPQEGAAVANQFRSNAVKQTVAKLFAPHKSLTTKQNREILKLRDDLIRQMSQEATTTGTLNAITNRGNTQTAPWLKDMENMQQGADIVADAATLNWRGVLMKTAKKLSSQIGEEGAKRVLKNLTDTDPATVLETLQRLSKQAKTTGERRAYVIAMKEFAKVGRRPAAELGTVSATTQDE